MKTLLKTLALAAIMMLAGQTAEAKTSTKTTTHNSSTPAALQTTLNTRAAMGDYWLEVRGYGVRIRATPSLRGKVVGSVNWGDYLRCVGYVRGGNGYYGWYKVYYRGRIRYISEQYAG